MKLEEALKEMRKGKKIRRCDFEENNYIFYTGGNIVYDTQSGLLNRYSFNTLDFEREWETVPIKLDIFEVLQIIKKNRDNIKKVTIECDVVTVLLSSYSEPISELQNLDCVQIGLHIGSNGWQYDIPIQWEHTAYL